MLELLNDADVLKEYSLSNLHRYNHRTRIKNESVATHSFYVTLFCLKIMKSMRLSMETENKVLKLAALHDVAESETSDVPYDVKEKSPIIRLALNKLEQEYISKNWNEYYNIIYDSDELVQTIVELADAYSVLQYCLIEQKLGNCCNHFDEMITTTRQRINKSILKINGGHLDEI